MQGCDLADRARGQERMLFGGDKGDRFDIRSQALVGQSHAELEFEIRKDPQAAHDHLGVDLAGELDGQAAVAGHVDLWIVLERFAYQVHALLGREHQGFERLIVHSHDHFIEEAGGALGNIHVAVMNGIERPGE